jgi:hypothetical protein
MFKDKKCEFVDIRHAAKLASPHAKGVSPPVSAHMVWQPDDALNALFHVLYGDYPSSDEIGISYLKGIRSAIDMPDVDIPMNGAIPEGFVSRIFPIRLTGFELSYRNENRMWLNPAIVLGDANNFDDLAFFWNLCAAGASAFLYDVSQKDRLHGPAQEFISTLRPYVTSKNKHINIWTRIRGEPPQTAQMIKDTGLDFGEINIAYCSNDGPEIWNGGNIRPVHPQFTSWHHDVVPNCTEKERGLVTASFSLPNRPFLDDLDSRNQKYVVSVDAKQYRADVDGVTFNTPFVPGLNEFYGRNFHFHYDRARAEIGSLGNGIVGIITDISDQQLSISTIRVHEWIVELFKAFGIKVDRSEPGFRCSRLINQLGGLQGCRVFKVQGARTLIEKYKPDQSFVRGEAERCIGNFDETAKQLRFDEYKSLHIQYRTKPNLTPGEVFEYLVSHEVFRVGLEFKCPSCELASWTPLDDVKTISTCVYCGHSFNITPQLKGAADWRHRRTGLFGRDDHQQGGIPVALALQQLETTFHDRLLMCSTALTFEPKGANIEKCEADFVAIMSGVDGIREHPTQIVLGEAKTHKSFDEQDVVKLGKLADAIPSSVAETFVMFAKTDAFTEEEIRLAQKLNSQYHFRVILWSKNELEPYHAYERSEDKLGNNKYPQTLTDLARATHQLYFASTSR